MILAADYPFLEILGTMILFFCWVIWIWTLVVILSDVFRRSDLSGWGKAGWTAFLIFLPFLGALIYLGAHGREMGERRVQDAEAALARTYQRAGGGGASEIAQAKSLLDSGAINQAEFEQLKAKAMTG
jgi:hypothetical protein